MPALCQDCDVPFVLDEDGGGFLCNRCGRLAPADQNLVAASWNDDGDTFVSGSRRIDDGDMLSGTYGHARGQSYAAVNSKKRIEEASAFVRSLARIFRLEASAERALHLYKSYDAISTITRHRHELYAAACFVVAIREQKRPITIREIALEIQIDVLRLSAAFNDVLRVLKIKVTETDTLATLLRYLAHLEACTKDHSSGLTSADWHLPGSKNNKLTTLAYLKKADFPAVQALALRALSFANSIHLYANRNTPIVANALVLVALEGSLQLVAPLSKDIAEELGQVGGTSSWSALERYREFGKAIFDWAEYLPDYKVHDERMAGGDGRRKVPKRVEQARLITRVLDRVPEIRTRRIELGIDKPQVLQPGDEGYEDECRRLRVQAETKAEVEAEKQLREGALEKLGGKGSSKPDIASWGGGVVPGPSGRMTLEGQVEDDDEDEVADEIDEAEAVDEDRVADDADDAEVERELARRSESRQVSSGPGPSTLAAAAAVTASGSTLSGLPSSSHGSVQDQDSLIDPALLERDADADVDAPALDSFSAFGQIGPNGPADFDLFAADFTHRAPTAGLTTFPGPAQTFHLASATSSVASQQSQSNAPSTSRYSSLDVQPPLTTAFAARPSFHTPAFPLPSSVLGGAGADPSSYNSRVLVSKRELKTIRPKAYMRVRPSEIRAAMPFKHVTSEMVQAERSSRAGSGGVRGSPESAAPGEGSGAAGCSSGGQEQQQQQLSRLAALLETHTPDELPDFLAPTSAIGARAALRLGGEAAITDEELFGPGELDGYTRSAEDAAALDVIWTNEGKWDGEEEREARRLAKEAKEARKEERLKRKGPGGGKRGGGLKKATKVTKEMAMAASMAAMGGGDEMGLELDDLARLVAEQDDDDAGSDVEQGEEEDEKEDGDQDDSRAAKKRKIVDETDEPDISRLLPLPRPSTDTARTTRSTRSTRSSTIPPPPPPSTSSRATKSKSKGRGKGKGKQRASPSPPPLPLPMPIEHADDEMLEDDDEGSDAGDDKGGGDAEMAEFHKLLRMGGGEWDDVEEEGEVD